MLSLKSEEDPSLDCMLDENSGEKTIEFYVDDSGLDPLGNDDARQEKELVAKFLEGELDFDYVQRSFFETLNLDDDKKDVSAVPSTSKEEVSPENEKEGPVVGKLKKVVRKVTKLPPALKCLMGEANLRYARGDKTTAVKICLEIIRQVPTAAEPFQTLAGLYEEMGDQENSLLMSLIAAHLTPTDVYGWLHLADLSEELGKIRQAISCCTKAIKLDITNMELHKKRTALLEKVGDKRTAMKGYMKLLYSLDSSQGEYVVLVAKFVAEMCHKENDLEKACSALEIAVEKCPKLIRFDFVNIHLELLILLKNFKRCLEVLVEFCDMVFEAETSVDNETQVETFEVIDCSFPESTPIDILSKLAVILIHMHAFHLLEKIMVPILALDASEVGELYLDFAEAYTDENKHDEACMLYCVLVNSESYSLPGVWLKYAESLKVLGRLDEAVDAYYNVLEAAQQHNNVKLNLASLLVQLGRQEEAVNILSQHEDDPIDASLLYERCKLLKDDPDKKYDLVTIAKVFFLRHSIKINSRDELKAISTLRRYYSKRSTVMQMRQVRKDLKSYDDLPEFKMKGPDDPSLEEEWLLFKDVCDVCLKNKMYSYFHSFTVIAQLSNLFNPTYKYEIDILSAFAAYLNKDSYSAYNIIRFHTFTNVDNSKLWQLFNLIINKSDDARHSRFIMRLLSRNPNSQHLGIIHANNCLVSGTYKYAIHEYSICYKHKPTTLCTLLLGLTYLQMAAQKFTAKKHCVVLQAIGFLSQYKEMRGAAGLQEANYNLGRAFHHLGLFSTAIHYYKLALSCEPALAEETPKIFNLQREAAFNLHLIYLHSEAYDMARMYIDRYIVV